MCELSKGIMRGGTVFPRLLGNVCAIRRKSDGYWWECNAEHGAGWSERIRQAWTLREAREQMLAMLSRGVDVADIEIVELVPAWTRDEAKEKGR